MYNIINIIYSINHIIKKIKNNNSILYIKGFTIIDILIILSIMSILISLSTPNIKSLIKSYKLRMASTDLVSYMNMAKLKAAKQNYQWAINFNPSGYIGYEVYYTDDNGSNISVAKVNFNNCDSKSNYTKCYSYDISFDGPLTSETCKTAMFQFNPNGLTNVGCIFISNKEHTGYYRVGLLAASGIIRMEKWSSKSRSWE